MVLSCLVLSCLVLSCLVLSCLVLSHCSLRQPPTLRRVLAKARGIVLHDTSCNPIVPGSKMRTEKRCWQFRLKSAVMDGTNRSIGRSGPILLAIYGGFRGVRGGRAA